jgi:hypothetical protein
MDQERQKAIGSIEFLGGVTHTESFTAKRSRQSESAPITLRTQAFLETHWPTQGALLPKDARLRQRRPVTTSADNHRLDNSLRLGLWH